MAKLWQIKGFLEERGGTLYVAGKPAPEIAKIYRTPVFVFSKNRILHNINRILKIQSVIDCGLKVCYAAKANSHPSVLSTVRESGIDIEVNSGGELKMALELGFGGGQIIFNGSSKTVEELETAIRSEIYAIQVDSLYELELIDETAYRLGRTANVSLRLVPEIESETHRGLQTALLTSKFGMMPDEAVTALKKWRPDDKNLNICGIHIHLGSQNPVMAPYESALITLFENLCRIRRETGHRLSHINIGGGFPVNYMRDDSHAAFIDPKQRDLLAANYEPADALRPAWRKLKAIAAEMGALELLDGLELLIEPGRSVIGDAGVCLTTVRNRKERPLTSSSGLGIPSSKFLDQKPESKNELDSDLIQARIPASSDTMSYLEPGASNVEPDEVADDPEPPNPEQSKSVWILTDAGFNILLSMETYKWYYHLISAVRADEPHRTQYKVAGPLCDGGDVYFDIEGKHRLPDHRLLPENVQPGELLALLNTGAYTVSQMFPYNGRELPDVVMI